MINKDKIRSNSVYENRSIHENNDNLGINRPYELGHGDGDPGFEIAYSNCISVMMCQFSPIFKNSAVYNFPETGYYANFWVPLYSETAFVGRRHQDYKNAHLALLRDFNNADINIDLAEKDEMIKTIKGWNSEQNYSPEGYLWHHVFMGFEENAISIEEATKSTYVNKFYNPHIEDCETLFCGKSTANLFKKIEIHGINVLNASNWITGYDGVKAESCDWNYNKFAIMQLVNAEIHKKTCPHLGSNFQRDCLMGITTPDED